MESRCPIKSRGQVSSIFMGIVLVAAASCTLFVSKSSHGNISLGIRHITLNESENTPDHREEIRIPDEYEDGSPRLGVVHRYAPEEPDSTYLDILGKVPLLQTLGRAGVTIDDEEVLAQLPAWSQVEELYGARPVISGLEKCHDFRESNTNEQVLLTSAGLYRTGISLLDRLLEENCKNIPVVKNPWWKHSPASMSHAPRYILEPGEYKKNMKELVGEKKKDYTKNILQIVLIRDPFHWVASVCQSNRFKDTEACQDMTADGEHFTLKGLWVRRDEEKKGRKTQKNYDSFIDLWNKWHDEQSKVSHPQLMIRYEDLIFHAEEVVENVCRCGGGRMMEHFTYKTDSNNLSVGAFLADSMISYGKVMGRIERFSTEEVAQARENLDNDLMRKFRYAYPHLPQLS